MVNPWRRFQKLKPFNRFLFGIFLAISTILIWEISSKTLSGADISPDQWFEYLAVWLSFLFGIVFINAVDFIVRSLSLIFKP